VLRRAKPVIILFLLADLVIAALWAALILPSSTGHVSRQVDTALMGRLVVGPMFIPPHNDCPVSVPASSLVTAPNGVHLAQFVPVPASLGQSVAVTAGPCPGVQPSGRSSVAARQPPSLAGL
jgi:hypothetical protein